MVAGYFPRHQEGCHLTSASAALAPLKVGALVLLAVLQQALIPAVLSHALDHPRCLCLLVTCRQCAVVACLLALALEGARLSLLHHLDPASTLEHFFQM